MNPSMQDFTWGEEHGLPCFGSRGRRKGQQRGQGKGTSPGKGEIGLSTTLHEKRAGTSVENGLTGKGQESSHEPLYAGLYMGRGERHQCKLINGLYQMGGGVSLWTG